MSPGRKNRIFLPDYDYRRDIENRLIMAELTSFEVEVLKEITNGPLQVSVGQIQESLGATDAQLLPLLRKFSKNKLLSLQNDQTILLEKERRKYFEIELQKFDANFEPGLAFLESLLNKVPREVLLGWYWIPRNSDRIFLGLVEKYMRSPKIYDRYIYALTFDKPVYKQIIHTVFTAPDFQVEMEELMGLYSLTREELAESILLLEFHLVCCSRYVKEGERWREVVTPFHEWREYLRFLRDSAPQPIINLENLTYQQMHRYDDMVDSFSHKLVCEIRRSLKRVIDRGWVYFEDFMRGFHSPVGETEPLLLKKGKRWRYTVPCYSEKEVALIEATIFQRLFSAGIVITGTHNGRSCFSVTPFGRDYLED